MRKIDKISTSTNTLLVLQEARFAFYIEPITTKRYDVMGVKIITWPLSRWWERNIYEKNYWILLLFINIILRGRQKTSEVNQLLFIVDLIF